MNFYTHFNRLSKFLLLGLVFSLVLSACGNDDDMPDPDPDPDPVSTDKTSGFVVTGTTSSGSSLVKYYDEMPSGTVDLSDGKRLCTFLANCLL